MTIRYFLAEDAAVDYVRNVAFRGVHAVSGLHPRITATPEQHVSDLEFTDFALEIKYDPALEEQYKLLGTGMMLRAVKNLVFNNFRYTYL